MYDYPDSAGLAAVLAVLGFLSFIFLIGFYVLSSWFLMKIFDKAGVQGRWRAWVPVYNYMVFAKLGDLNPWLVLIGLGAGIVLSWVPVIGWLLSLATFVLTLLAAWRVGLKLQKEAVWLILYFFLSIVWLGILAFDKSRWNTAVPAAPWAGNGFLSDRTNWRGIPAQTPAGGYPANPVTQPAYPAPGAYPPPAGYDAPPAGYSAPPAGYSAPPAGYTPPAPSEPPAGYTPPPAAAAPAPSSPEPPAAAPSEPAPPVTPEPPTAPGPEDPNAPRP
ncbi:DUF5684 domain-containing protein [Microbacterium sp. 4R-513]|uniref:DUF5684 domain-containing protein n=1 Tax=Microbacterium sp. 4R-513 TaxID=2567934 RepID=UPI0019D05340|nr:DUF5684 domain-containing protein [Microbacterium sp. 4R-513]